MSPKQPTSALTISPNAKKFASRPAHLIGSNYGMGMKKHPFQFGKNRRQQLTNRPLLHEEQRHRCMRIIRTRRSSTCHGGWETSLHGSVIEMEGLVSLPKEDVGDRGAIPPWLTIFYQIVHETLQLTLGPHWSNF